MGQQVRDPRGLLEWRELTLTRCSGGEGCGGRGGGLGLEHLRHCDRGPGFWGHGPPQRPHPYSALASGHVRCLPAHEVLCAVHAHGPLGHCGVVWRRGGGTRGPRNGAWSETGQQADGLPADALPVSQNRPQPHPACRGGGPDTPLPSPVLKCPVPASAGPSAPTFVWGKHQCLGTGAGRRGPVGSK